MSSLLTLGIPAFSKTVTSFMAGILGVNGSQLTVTDLILEPGTVLTASAQQVQLRAGFTVMPADSYSAYVVGSLEKSYLANSYTRPHWFCHSALSTTTAASTFACQECLTTCCAMICNNNHSWTTLLHLAAGNARLFFLPAACKS